MLLTNTIERPWVTVEQACLLLDIKPKTASNQLSQGTFPLPTFKLGRTRAVMIEVISGYFERHVKDGLKKLDDRLKKLDR
jgi:hypothetical protein